MPLERAINVFALLEAETVTGPAGNLLQFHRTAFALSAAGRAPSVRLTLAVFQRGGAETRRTPSAKRLPPPAFRSWSLASGFAWTLALARASAN